LDPLRNSEGSVTHASVRTRAAESVQYLFVQQALSLEKQQKTTRISEGIELAAKIGFANSRLSERDPSPETSARR